MQTVERLCLAAFIAAGDTVIKNRISEPLKTKNRGFALNRLDKYPGAVAAVSGLLTAVTAYGLVKTKKYGVAYALILGGALSNTYERLFKGYVTDYIKIGKVVYNLSDFAIFAGALMYVFESIGEEIWEK